MDLATAGGQLLLLLFSSPRTSLLLIPHSFGVRCASDPVNDFPSIERRAEDLTDREFFRKMDDQRTITSEAGRKAIGRQGCDISDVEDEDDSRLTISESHHLPVDMS